MLAATALAWSSEASWLSREHASVCFRDQSSTRVLIVDGQGAYAVSEAATALYPLDLRNRQRHVRCTTDR